MQRDDEFELYDLAVVVEAIDGNCNLRDAGRRLLLPAQRKIALPEGCDFCLYDCNRDSRYCPPSSARNHPGDWMETDAPVTCLTRPAA